jgi:hypothetical protein
MNHFDQKERDAARKIEELLDKPLGNGIEDFDPWEMLGMYGTYDMAFDVMAIDTLSEIAEARIIVIDRPLSHDMFREILCHKNLCDYGSSPRSCFPTQYFKPLIMPLIEKWYAHTIVVWKDAPAPREAPSISTILSLE